MMNKQYTFSLPPKASKVIDSLPKMAKSQRVTEALLLFEKYQARKRSLDVLASLKLKDWGTTKDSVTLVREARQIRAEHLINNSHK